MSTTPARRPRGRRRQPRLRPRWGRIAIVAAVLLALVVAVGITTRLVLSGSPSAQGPAATSSPSASAALPTPASRVVTSGDARFEVLSSTLIRTEYAGDARFVDAATYNVVGRDRFTRVGYTATTADGWLTIDTGAMTLRYRVDSGAFTSTNLRLAYTSSTGQQVAASPWAPAATATGTSCAYGMVCQAERGALAGGAAKTASHNGYSGSGFVGGMAQGASTTVSVTRVPADGRATVQIRYASALGGAHTVALSVNGSVVAHPRFAPTSGWDYWSTVSVPVDVTAGTDRISIGCPSAGTCGMTIDSIAVADAESPVIQPHAALGGYRRDLDLVDGKAITNPGLLYQDGWSLVDDTASDTYDAKTGTLTARGAQGDGYQDGYVFAYGTDYATALGDLATLTGPSELLPRYTYGVWYSEYYDRTQTQLQDVIVPRFRSEGVPIDMLAIDTDYKSPDAWNGWEVDTAKFPDLSGFTDWLHDNGIHDTFNIHPSISPSDPQFAAAQKIADGSLTRVGNAYVFDWSDPNQLKAYEYVHREIGDQGVDSWWLDWCCRLPSSTYSAAGVTPDAFINGLYAQWTAENVGGRGFAFARAYGSLSEGGYGQPEPVATGPWADKRTTVHFTGDTISTWQTLAFEVGYTPGESASTGLSPVSHDIGGFKEGNKHPGAEAGSTQLDPDLYARWVQLGTFQPIDRLHGHHSDRLPWQYGGSAGESASDFLNLRENLLPLTYTLAEEAERTGVPVVRPLYLEYPDQDAAYAMAGSEYLYGSDVLVAPVTTPGSSAKTTVWFPAGSDWTDWFTGKTYRGGTTATITSGLDTMPVFVRSGGIVPLRSTNVTGDSVALTAVTLKVAAGADGAFDLFEDDGTTTDRAQSATTHVAYTQSSGGGSLSIAAPEGSFDGQIRSRTWTLQLQDVATPTSVTVDGSPAAASAWSYDAGSRTLIVHLAKRSVDDAATIAFTD